MTQLPASQSLNLLDWKRNRISRFQQLLAFLLRDVQQGNAG